ncbi:MAG: hypothetical protein AMJ81_01935 [Phycisphaerae bacterium SM23_33]|nr:MAG: hypothetical protein AMJ81_01935 [Phycisphaerae bacterium SM23_33]
MLGDISPDELAGIVKDRLGSPAMPYLHDEQVRRRAVGLAAAQGFFEYSQRQLTPDEPIGVLPHSGFREFRRTGNRTNYERLTFWRSGQIQLAAAACYLGLDYLTYLQDLLWAECESTWWTMPAHEDRAGPIDLRVAMCGFQYAQVVELLRDSMDPEIRQRVLSEVRRRVLDEYLDPRRTFWWKAFSNNWNAVCNGAVGLAALLIEKDPGRLARTLTDVLENLPYFLGGFAADGGCTEGPSYWRYGFSWYADFAAALYDFTAGRVNIMAGERIATICRYPLAMWVRPGEDLSFADCHQGFLSTALAVQINRFHDLPELFDLCRLSGDGSPGIASLSDLLLYDGRKHEPLAEGKDYHLPELGVVKLRRGDLTVGAKAGHNDEHHNHNDVGSFLVHRGSTFFLTDLGAPVYSRRTFSPRRYESIFCNSLGHSVPVIDGKQQGQGRDFAGTLSVDGLNGQGTKTIHIEMAGAYGQPHLRRLTRVVELPPGGREVLLADTFVFAKRPESVAEAFMTTLPAEAAEDGSSVTIRSEADGAARLAAVQTAGRFTIEELREESAESRSGELIRRIVFVPSRLAPEMALSFAVRFE